MTELHVLADYRAEGAGSVSAAMVSEALKALGGAAHRDAIVGLVFGRLGPGFERAQLTAEVDRVLRHHAGEAALFEQVFGPGSYRWRLGPGSAAPAPAPRPERVQYVRPQARRRAAVAATRIEPL